jgi:hypothetical protein
MIVWHSLNLNSLAQDTKPSDAVIKACRDAVAEVVSLREREAILKKTVDQLKRDTELRDERLALLEKSIAEYERAIEARKRAESVVEELRKSYQNQIALAEKEISNQKRRVRLWQLLSAVAVVFALISGTKN